MSRFRAPSTTAREERFGGAGAVDGAVVCGALVAALVLEIVVVVGDADERSSEPQAAAIRRRTTTQRCGDRVACFWLST